MANRLDPEEFRFGKGDMTADEDQLEGLWCYTAYEDGGSARSSEELAAMAKLVLLPGPYLPGWHGLWAVVTVGYEGGVWSDAELYASCRHRLLGTDRVGQAPAADFYLYAGGRFRIAPHRSPKEIDFEQFFDGVAVPSSLQLGLYKIADGRLTLCEAESGRPRPTGFTSGQSPRQSLGELVRCESG